MSSPSAFSIDDFAFDLPDALIAQEPLARRSASRLLQLKDGEPSHHSIIELPTLLREGDLLVFNDTRVVPARLKGRKASGGAIEFMLEQVLDEHRVAGKLRASRSPGIGSDISLSSADGERECRARVQGRDDDLFLLESADPADPLPDFIEQHGEIPLPPYIQRQPDERDRERYQTVFAERNGAVAAPTAGLHFDDELLMALEKAGIGHTTITLHVGAGTFQPVRVEDPDKHVMHAERTEVSSDSVARIEATKAEGGRVIAVGTTSVRSLESAARQAGSEGRLQPFEGETRLFLRPGAEFHVIDGMLTNFHLPRSTLLMLVAAFAGLDATLNAYREAVAEQYRSSVTVTPCWSGPKQIDTHDSQVRSQGQRWARPPWSTPVRARHR